MHVVPSPDAHAHFGLWLDHRGKLICKFALETPVAQTRVIVQKTSVAKTTLEWPCVEPFLLASPAQVALMKLSQHKSFAPCAWSELSF